MPYAMESPLGAGLAAAAGFMGGQTDRKKYLLEQQRQATLDAQAQADTAARLDLQRSQDEATNAYRTTQTQQRGRQLDIDKANSDREQGTADALAAKQSDAEKKQKLIDAFQGQGLHYPKNWTTMKPEQKVAYLQVRLNAAQKAGDSKTVSNTETEINRVATQAEADRRDAALAKQRDTQNANTTQRIVIEQGRAGAAAGRAAATAGDPQSLADVSGRLAHAKNRDDAQRILDSPEGSLLSDRQYARLQKQVDETYGTHQQSQPKTPKAAKPTALDEVKIARQHGIKDNNLIINTLVGNGYTENAARAAVKAAP